MGCLSVHKLKGRWFDSQSGYVPGLQTRSLVGGVQEAKGNQPVSVSLARQCFSTFLPSFPFLQK